ncbi:hypothetical protein KA111_00165 [Candidatus Woesebacteria bacterium]|nr:hypothetical protein [Candidatus Woesebacteria bacterium]
MQENLGVNDKVKQIAYSSQKSPYLTITIFLAILVVILLVNSFLSLKNRASNNIIPDNTSISDSVNDALDGSDSKVTDLSNMLAENDKLQQNIYPITSSYKGFVQENKEGLIDVTPLDKSSEPYTISKYGKKYDGGALGLGNTGLMLAPDLQKFAFSEDGKVFVVGVDGEKELKIDLKGVQYITGWSSDSNLLLVYVSSNIIKSNLESGGPGYEPPDQFEVDQNLTPSGFVLIDFKNGSMRHMVELDGMLVYSWVGSEGLIISTGMGQNEFFVYYSIAEKMVDRKAVNSLNEVFGQQMSFSEDGKKWSTVTSIKPNSTEMAKATIGNFPKMGDIASIEFPWASRQRPRLSPQGNMLALVGYEILNGPQYVYLYDGKDIKQIVEGIPEIWIDESKLLYTNTDSVFIYNLLTKESTKLR